MITREEIIEVCNNLGLMEFSTDGSVLEDYRPWRFSNSIFKNPSASTIVVLAKNPHDKVIGPRLYFYNKLKYSKSEGFTMECEDGFNAYCSKNGKDYAELYNKKSFETALKNVIKKIKTTAINLKLKNVQKDF